MFLNDKKVGWHKSEGIYSGVSGIVLFLIELFKKTSDDKYLEAAIHGANWVDNYCAKNKTTYYAFLTGRLGAAYMLVQLAEVSGEKAFLKKALKIAKGCEIFLEQEHTLNEFINGASGALLALMHLHQASGEDWLLDSINTFTAHLIDHVYHGENGLYWDRSDKSIKGLCGFSHGAAGVGFVFLELGYYFKNKAFYQMAEQAFFYENSLFNEKIGNWPDFRKGNYNEETNEQFKAAYLANNYDFFETPGDMTAWCHGAPGIGLSRLRALELLEKEEYRNDYLKAEKKTLEKEESLTANLASFTLCHGAGGNAMLLLEAHRLLKENYQQNRVTSIVERLLKVKKDDQPYLPGYSTVEKTEDSSLFMGNAGIGYFLLQYIEPLNTASVLSPVLKNRCKQDFSSKPDLNLNAFSLKKKLMEKAFPLTINLLEEVLPNEIHDYFQVDLSLKREGIKEEFKKFLRKVLSQEDLVGINQIRDVFKYEMAKTKLQSYNPAYLSIKNQFLRERAAALLALEVPQLMKKKIQLNNDASILGTAWNWNKYSKD
ncbi:hypothetical protein E1171_01650, partial [Cytophagales bacterium RKSG123]|nr:hypothetical protein [Xanthovirga aplysinae]